MCHLVMPNDGMFIQTVVSYVCVSCIVLGILVLELGSVLFSNSIWLVVVLVVI